MPTHLYALARPHVHRLRAHCALRTFLALPVLVALALGWLVPAATAAPATHHATHHATHRAIRAAHAHPGQGLAALARGTYRAADHSRLSSFTRTGKAAVVGHATRGHRLRAVAPGLKPTASSLAYQWTRDGRALRGATSATYRPTAADVGHRLAVRITASAKGYADLVVTSAPVSVRAGGRGGTSPHPSGHQPGHQSGHGSGHHHGPGSGHDSGHDSGHHSGHRRHGPTPGR